MAGKRYNLRRVIHITFMEALGNRDGHGWTCFYCHRALRPYGDNFHPDSPAIEHSIPLARGGTDDISNLRLTCTACNQAKGTQTEQEFTGKSSTLPPGLPALPSLNPTKTQMTELQMELHNEWVRDVHFHYNELRRLLYPRVTAGKRLDDNAISKRTMNLKKTNW